MFIDSPARNETLLAKISQLADTIALDASGHAAFRRSAWDAIAGTGLLSELTDAPVDAAGRVMRTMAALERLGEICDDTGLNFSVATHLASTICAVAKFGGPELQERYLHDLTSGRLIGAHAISEPGSGSDALAMMTSATRDGDDFILDGRKAFVTNGPVADVIVVYAKTRDGKGVANVSAFLVPTDIPGVVRGPALAKSGFANSPLGPLQLDRCRVPAKNMIGREGSGFSVLSYVMKREILFAFVITVGEMRRRLDTCVAYANQRRQFGANIGSFQSVSNRLADMKIRYELSQKWLYYVADKVRSNDDITSDIAIAKIFVSESAVASALDAIQIHGGRGILSENKLDADLASAVAGPIYSGTNDIQRGRIAALLGVNR